MTYVGYLRALGLIDEFPEWYFGTINGERLLVIEEAYLTAFFDRCLKGEHGENLKLLKGPSDKFPEVSFWKGK